ncbi:MAG TPA: ABC transporter ATP-binding protein [Conexibacter sp.]|nr:ABC transporter ATP-binding protein [Conexibacter sp.]
MHGDPRADRIDGIAVRGVRFARGERVVLRDVSFDAPKGAVTALVGPSGIGKSTLLRCLNRLLVPDAGTVLLDGEDTAALDPCALRRRAGLVGQTPTMLPGSVRENLAYGLDPASAADQPRLTRALADAGLDAAFLDRPAAELSGGERARVALARALTREPELLLLDEPTAALDAAVARHIGGTLTALARAGLGVVVATHDLPFAAAIADRVVALRDGGAIVGSPQELLAGGAPAHAADAAARHASPERTA